MKILAFDHIQIAIPVGEEQKARAFYGNLLGLAEIAKPAALTHRGGAWFESEDVILHLGVEEEFHPNRKAHPALVVDDLKTYLDVCRLHGVEIDEKQPPLPGYLRAHIFDPFGNRLELMEKLKA